MGMYDTINHEQIKCFPHIYLYNDSICYSGGSLSVFNTKNRVPYKTLYYNYGKNFMILDVNTFQDIDDTYDYVLHVIRNGKVKETYTDTIGEEDFSLNETVVGYWGNLLNIKTKEDCIDYIKELRIFIKEKDEIRKNWNVLLKELNHVGHGLGALDKSSDEYKERSAKFFEIHKKMDKEQERIADAQKALEDKFFTKWSIEIKEDIINFGEYLFVLSEALNSKDSIKDELEVISKKILELTKQNPNIVEEYIKWYNPNKKQKEELENLIDDIFKTSITLEEER